MFGAESLFYLAVLDCVKPDIDQVASVVYCMIDENSKDDRSNYLKSQYKILAGKQQHKNFQVRNPDGTAQLQQHSNLRVTPAQLLLDYTATSCCIQRFNLSLSHLSPFGCNKVTNSVKEVFVMPIQEKKIIFEKHNCVHMHTHKKQIQRVIGNYIAQQNNLEI